jgi:DNA-3-methyladenine glycosylase II
MQEAIHHLRAADPILAGIIERVGAYRIEFREPGFETLVKAIIFQQLSGRVANVIFARLVKAAGEPLTGERVLKLRPSRMRSLGLSKQKIAYIRDLARQVRSGDLDFAALSDLSDEEVIQALTSVKGVGVWTAHMFLIFALRRPNILPVGDLGIRAAIRRAYGKAELPTPGEVVEMARPWHPWCTVASWYLWRSLEPNANL